MKRWLGKTGLLGRDAIEMFIDGTRFARMYHTVAVFRRRIQRVQLQWLAAGIDDVVQRAAGNDDGIIGLDRVTGSVDQYFTLPGLDTEELIVARMYFLADVLPRLQCHQHQLQVLARVQNPAEIRVFLGQLLDVINKTFHFFPRHMTVKDSLCASTAVLQRQGIIVLQDHSTDPVQQDKYDTACIHHFFTAYSAGYTELL